MDLMYLLNTSHICSYYFFITIIQACMSVCIPHVCSTCLGRKRMSGPLAMDMGGCELLDGLDLNVGTKLGSLNKNSKHS